MSAVADAESALIDPTHHPHRRALREIAGAARPTLLRAASNLSRGFPATMVAQTT